MIRWQSPEQDKDNTRPVGVYPEKRDKQAIPIVSFVGKSNSGKTTLLEKVIRELKSKGYRVATIKHSHHEFDTDQPGKDTWRFAQAGSDAVIISSPSKLAFVEHVDTEFTLAQIEALFRERVDIVLAEGYKNGNAPKILVSGTEQNHEQLCCKEETLAVVSPRLSSQGVPQFDSDDVANILDLLIELIGKSPPRKLRKDSGIATVTAACDTYQASEFERLLAESATVHGHICPGQVLGIRMAMRGCRDLGIIRPKEEDKRLIVYVEIDRCATDAIQVVTGCKLGKRTMKYVDYGKLAATFVDLRTGAAVRVAAREDAREKASFYCRQGWTKHEAEVAAYKAMSDEELFHVERVQVEIPVEDMPGPPLRRVICDECGEGVNDCREVTVAGRVLCQACAYGSYYQRNNALEREYATSAGHR